MSEGLDSRGDRAAWEARYRERGSGLDHAPSAWVGERCAGLPRDALIVDIAGGTGRHAEAIARTGRTVILVDFVHRAVSAAVSRHERIVGVTADASSLPFRKASCDAVVCVSFLDRSLFKVLAEMLKPGGVLVYETFTRAHLDVVARGCARGPRDPAYLLEAGELASLVVPLVVQEHEEGLVVDDAGERHVARVMAVKRWAMRKPAPVVSIPDSRFSIPD